MRKRAIFLASVGLNIGLAAALVIRHRIPASEPAPVSPETNSVAANTGILPRVLVRKQFFAWSQIETNDYVAYIANLREIECPELTIRDIIISEINLLYAKRRAKEVPSLARQWWRSTPDPEFLRAATDKLKSLEAERVALLDKLLGPGWEKGLPEAQIPVVDLGGPYLEDLSPEARKAVEQIAQTTQSRADAYLRECEKLGQTPDAKELARLQQAAQTELAKYLSPVQLEEYLLRYSPTSEKLRRELMGFEATPDEFRQIYRSVDALTLQMQTSYPGDDAVGKKIRANLQAQSDLALKQTLGNDRFQFYQLTRDPAFAQARQVTEQFGASAEAVLPVYQINQMTQSELLKIDNDPTLNEEDRQAAIRQIQADQEKSIRAILAAKTLPPQAPAASNGPPMPPP
jgi:hypothetical protein